MSNIEERVQHNEDLIRGLSEQTSGNITIINSNCKMLANRLEALEKKVQELETKTASDLSQTVVAESATSEEQDCLWIARDKDGDLYAHAIKPFLENGCFESIEGSFLIYEDNFPEVTTENSPQRLVLESSISKTETVGKDVLDKLRALLSRIDKDYEENLEYSHYEEGQQDLIKEIREVIE